MIEKSGVIKYVGIVKKIFVAFSIVVLPAFMVFLVLAVNGATGFMIVAPIVLVVYLAVYAVYALKFSMGLAVGYQTTNEVVHIKTKRKVYTYDVKAGCTAVKATPRKFVCTFETQDSRDTFVFLRRAPFSPYSEEQFTADDLRKFFPAIDGVPNV